MKREEFTSLAATVAGVDEETGVISGVAVKYGIKIPRGVRLNEQVNAGTFAKQLADPARVQVLWQHDSDSPIGKVSGLEDSATQLDFRARITDHADVPDARKALALLREGVIDEVSVGFQWGTWTEERDEETGETTIVHTKARLREISVVTFGALGRDARVLTVASESAAAAQIDAYRARFGALSS